MRNVTDKLETLFEPRSVVIIGASPNTATPQGKAFKALLDNGYTGRVYAVNPNYGSINGHPCYARLEDIPQEIDTAVVAVAAARVPGVMRDCVKKGVKNVIVLSSGFAECSAAGKIAEEEMAVLAAKNGMRIMGPNCVGLINNLNGLWATFAAPAHKAHIRHPHALDLISQSGFFGMVIYQMIEEQGIGFTRYASIGNQADLTFSEFMDYFIESGNSKIIGGYIEGLKDGQAFLQAARKALEKEKVILVMKAGRSGPGAKAAQSHTGSMAGSDLSYDALFRQAGVIRVENIGQFVDFLSLAVPGRWPEGKRVAVISASGGGAVILTDQCIRHGLEIADLLPETRKEMEAVLPPFAHSGNPLDVTSQFLTEPDILWKCMNSLAADPNVDAVILSVHMQASLLQPVLDKLIQVVDKSETPFLFVGRLLGDRELVVQLESQILEAQIPLVRDENNAIWALGALARRHERMQLHKRSFCFPREETAAKPLDLTGEPAILTEYRAIKVLRAYGVSCALGILTFSVDDAAEAAERMGYPVALKVQSPDITHKTDAVGLFLNIVDEPQLKKKYQELINHINRKYPFAAMEGVLVQKMAPHGIETIIGMKRDPHLGPVIMFGMGGILAEVFHDITLRIAPLSKTDAEEMVEEIKSKQLFQGKGDHLGADKKAIVDTLLRISDLATANPVIREIDLNPFIVYEQGKGGVATDALIILAE